MPDVPELLCDFFDLEVDVEPELPELPFADCGSVVLMLADEEAPELLPVLLPLPLLDPLPVCAKAKVVTLAKNVAAIINLRMIGSVEVDDQYSRMTNAHYVNVF